ncbi:MAG: CrcB family protein [Actinomycetales bacterium]|nr:CrcB family protein [Actinomycetales bacterium]
MSLLRSRWDVLAVIGAGGALGSLARWGVGELVPWSGDTFPWATFIENVSGGFALGVLMVFVVDVWPPHRYLRPFLGVGLLGGYTTFSTYMLESRQLLVDGQLVTAFAYLGGSLLAGLTAVWVGISSARLVALGSRRRRQRRRQAMQPTADTSTTQVRNP